MARTGQRYRDQEAAQQRQHAQAFAKFAYRRNLIDQWIPYNNLYFGKLTITNGQAQTLFRLRSIQLPRGNIRRGTQSHPLLTTIRSDPTCSSI